MRKLLIVGMALAVFALCGAQVQAACDCSNTDPDKCRDGQTGQCCNTACCFGDFVTALAKCKSSGLSSIRWRNLFEGDGIGTFGACEDGAEESLGKCNDLLGATVIFVDVRVVRDTGKPQSFEADFNIAVPGVYALSAINGLEGEDRLSSAVVTVDGKRVLTPDCLNQSVDRAEVLFNLSAGQHTLRAEVRSKPGGFITFGLVLASRPLLNPEDRCPSNR